jgi:glycosyltransferase involved in cell wall biosynthesis
MEILVKKKILTIIPSLFDGGAEKFAADMSQHFSGTYNHTFIHYNQTEQTYKYSGSSIDITVAQRSGIVNRIIRQFEILKKIREIKKSLQPKLTISHMLMANMLNILSRKQGKTVCVLHGEWSIKTVRWKVLDYLIRYYYSKADVIISVSYYIKEMFNDYYKLDIPHEVIYNGIEFDEINQLAKKRRYHDLPQNYMVYVAGFRPVKNHVLLIKQLCSFLKENELPLVLLGDGELRNDIESMVRELQLEQKVLLLGNLTNPYPVIAGAKIALMMSSSESFSLSVLEAMALGIPVITTDCGGPREIILTDRNREIHLPFQNEFGIIIEKPEQWKHDTVEIQINNLITDNSLWNLISEQGKIRANKFSIRITENKYDQLINKLLHS